MSGAQMRKLAAPMMKNVGASLGGMTLPAQIRTRTVAAHRSIAVQKTRRVIFSVIK